MDDGTTITTTPTAQTAIDQTPTATTTTATTTTDQEATVDKVTTHRDQATTTPMIEDESDKSKKQTFLRDSKTLPDSIDQHQMMRHHRPKREKDVDHQKPPSTRMNDWYGRSLFNAVDIIRKYALKEIKYTIGRLTGRKIACPSVKLEVNGKQ